MKIAILAALAATATVSAVDVQPAPGLAIDPSTFTDLRLMVGVAAPITSASAAKVDYETDPGVGPHLGLQLVRGSAGDSLGVALGIELAYDDHRGKVSRATGVQTVYGTGDTGLHAVTIAVMPKLVLRPGFHDPIDWGPGSVQLELAPILGVGVGWAKIGGSPSSDPTTVWRWGARLDLVWTDNDHRWQAGFSLAWEAVDASPKLSGDASISGNGICGGLLLGRRL